MHTLAIKQYILPIIVLDSYIFICKSTPWSRECQQGTWAVTSVTSGDEGSVRHVSSWQTHASRVPLLTAKLPCWTKTQQLLTYQGNSCCILTSRRRTAIGHSLSLGSPARTQLLRADSDCPIWNKVIPFS